MKQNILVTGGAGYIGSHTCIELINYGFIPIIIDNFSNSNKKVIQRLEEISGQKLIVIETDIRNKNKLVNVINDYNCEAVIHFASFKALGESQKNPIEYYSNNLIGGISLLEAMKETGLKKIVFSSSASVYGSPSELPLKEDHPLLPENVYGKTKLIFENILKDTFYSDKKWRICILRYFNPIGAHKSSRIGEDPNGVPNNLMPYISQVAVGKLDKLNIWGHDYKTIDGTGVRDYIHVVDLAIAHVKAIKELNNLKCSEINLGTGKGYSVLQMIDAFEKASGMKIEYEYKERREGDIDSNFADCTKAQKILDWQAKYSIFEMCLDTWKWQKNNPNGYQE